MVGLGVEYGRFLSNAPLFTDWQRLQRRSPRQRRFDGLEPVKKPGRSLCPELVGVRLKCCADSLEK
jgi:hypothetical protein